MRNQVNTQDPEALAEAEMLRLLQSHPVASAKSLERPPLDDESLIMIIDEAGIPRAETIRHLYENGQLADLMKQRSAPRGEEKENKDQQEGISPGAASGFITEQGGDWYVISNNHVFNGSADVLEQLMTASAESDITAAPGELISRCPGDQYPLPLVPISAKLRNADLPMRRVRISGFGARFFTVEGFPLAMKRCIGCAEEDRKKVEGKFALIVSEEEMGLHEPFGMSGSRVEDTETGEVVGVFHSMQPLDERKGHFCLYFSGIDDLRAVLAEAKINRQRDGERYDIDSLMKRGKAQIPPPPTP